ncbi:diacylglycerol kinase family protein [Terrimonas pollutisoli]|uniref:diacylglycerol kinase family protein n=1 Tax=Terrimonas pollutisoli TaxID=3034147 RepID=UPI0023EC4A10|nr:diacylglycerol kinase family protein [Terrimonas sp. H1YJ31]
MKQKTISFRSRLSSFGFAARGIQKFFEQEPNAWLHLVATIGVFASSVYFGITSFELLALVIVTGFVWVAEMFNTVIERVMDFISPAYHSQVAFIKDLAAGAVLMSAVIAATTGLIVFIPKII